MATEKLHQFYKVPFSSSKGIASFQHLMVKLSEEDTFPYFDNITFVGSSQAEHDENIWKFLEIVLNRKLSDHVSFDT